MSDPVMLPKRRIFFQVSCILLVIVVVLQSWVFARKPKAEAAGDLLVPPSSKSPVEQEVPYEERMFSLHTKMLIGLVSYLRDGGAEFLRGQLVASDLETMLRNSFRQANYNSQINPKITSPSGSLVEISAAERRLLQKKLIAARYLEIPDLAQDLCGQLARVIASNGQGSAAAATWLALCREAQSEDLTEYRFEADGPATLHSIAAGQNNLASVDDLGWFGDLLQYLSLTPDAPQREELKKSALVSLQQSALRMFAAIGIVALMLSLGMIVLLGFIFILARGRLQFSFVRCESFADWSLEIFTIYLAGMLVLPLAISAVRGFGVSFDLFAANCLIISVLGLTIFWPLFWGQNYPSIRRALGLDGRLFWRTIGDGFAGFSGYLAALPILLLLLFAYSLVLTNFEINPSEGAHPVVPLLAAAQSNKTIWLIFSLAVVAAPIIEEIMFRGALYGWLRARAGAGASIVISALIFAAVHPQGALGLLPLAFIGAVLALLREWRGSLAAPIIAHACFNAGTLLLVVTTLRA